VGDERTTFVVEDREHDLVWPSAQKAGSAMRIPPFADLASEFPVGQ
jgi:hypothetical protein